MEMNPPLQGSDGSTISFDGQFVEITRKGGFSSLHRKGTKRIAASSIRAIQLKEPGLTVGFIQFTIGADAPRTTHRGGTASEAVRDENAVVFKRNLVEFQELRDRIERAIANPGQPGGAPSVADELVKLANLRATGILTEDEFQTQKARLLGS